MRDQLLYQQLMTDSASRQWLDYVETLFSAYTEAFILLSVIVLISIAWLCASELRVSSKPARPKSNNSYPHMAGDPSST
jgi:hypothetical protein